VGNVSQLSSTARDQPGLNVSLWVWESCSSSRSKDWHVSSVCASGEGVGGETAL